jgi:crotonobetainyl-CoA:carnitine CoA-transferase CaiB-like acyl-CoA transferase
MATHTTQHWYSRLDALGVPVSDVKFPVEVFDDPQLVANDMVLDLDHPSLGTLRLLASPLDLDQDGFQLSSAMPAFASETRTILGDLGFAPDHIDKLLQDGVTQYAPTD